MPKMSTRIELIVNVCNVEIREWSSCDTTKLRSAALERRVLVGAVSVIPTRYYPRRRPQANA